MMYDILKVFITNFYPGVNIMQNTMVVVVEGVAAEGKI